MPDTNTNVSCGLDAASERAADSVRSYVTRVYSASDIPADDTPTHQKHASCPASPSAIGERSPRSAWISSRSFGWC
nr:hypothetical protein [Nannocystis bainbridge]